MEEQKKVEGFNFLRNYSCITIFKVILVVVVVLFLGRVIIGGGRYSSPDLQKDTIVVSGKGEIAVKPDLATVSFSVSEENLDVAKASDAVNSIISKIVADLEENGVDEKDIKTTSYNIYPRYEYINTYIYPYTGKQVLAGYNVSQSIDLKIRDLSKAGKIISDLGEMGATNMSSLTFTNDKYDDLVKQARDEAIKQARDEAQKLAKSLGVRLVKIVGYSEGGNYPVYFRDAVSSSLGKGGGEATLPAGENTITSNVSITYEIR